MEIVLTNAPCLGRMVALQPQAGNLLYPQPSGMTATMTCYPHDHLDKWRFRYPREVFQAQFRKLCEKWEEGLELIREMPDCEFKDMAFYGYTLFAASRNQIDFVIGREEGADKALVAAVVENELEQAVTALKITLRNSSIGYEAANHYYVPRSALAEKIVQCRYLLESVYN